MMLFKAARLYRKKADEAPFTPKLPIYDGVARSCNKLSRTRYRCGTPIAIYSPRADGCVPRGMVLKRLRIVRSLKTEIRTADKAGDQSQNLSPPPYGGSDRIVFLRSLPLSSLHALLVVACTMAFFVSLAVGHNDDGILAKRSLSGPLSMVRPAGSTHAAATMSSPAGLGGRRRELPRLRAVAGHAYGENRTSLACRSGMTGDAITGRDPNDFIIIAAEIQIHSCLDLLPGPSARHLIRSTSEDTTQVAPANFPRLC